MQTCKAWHNIEHCKTVRKISCMSLLRVSVAVATKASELAWAGEPPAGASTLLQLVLGNCLASAWQVLGNLSRERAEGLWEEPFRRWSVCCNRRILPRLLNSCGTVVCSKVFQHVLPDAPNSLGAWTLLHFCNEYSRNLLAGFNGRACIRPHPLAAQKRKCSLGQIEPNADPDVS